MKAILSIRLLLMVLLVGVGTGAAVAVQAEDTHVPAATAKGALGTPASSVKLVKKKTLPAKRTTSQKVARGKLKRRAPIAAKSVPASDALKTTLPPAKLDLSLPQDMVKRLEPLGTVPLSKSRPLLPPLFIEKNPEQTSFQLNGRLLKNEMDLQLRNENRKEVDGAALDFQFKQ
ncbi:hypothetical protein [Pseudomonas sp. FEN]|uniref:hypothetical protein n=1 Tax=Pseudomonas sp. FEN TaxID=2767468 RepID=UPI00174AB856|nr:hypothetical protein [Pseudomonas sp. FEN]CAD5197897.1 Translation initiation factor 2 (IF-2; GTPase) [Pseudomonas sp. FEN]